MSSSRKTRKKQKVEETSLWTEFEEIPLPPRENIEDSTNDFGRERDRYVTRLSESLLAAVCAGDKTFVRKVLQTKHTRSMLCIIQHKPQTNYTGTAAVFHEIYGLPAPPVQPYFGLTNIVWGLHSTTMNENLLISAVRSNQLEMVKELVLRQHFDINVLNWHQNPLTEAISLGFDEITDFLLDQPHIYLTHPGTECFFRGNGRSRPRCESTALSLAAGKGRLDIVHKLIEKGALCASSTSRSDDPYPVLTGSDAEEIVSLSVKEALVEAYDKADPFHLLNNGRSQAYADILEVLLSKTGEQKDNVVTVYVTDRIKTNDWHDISGHTMYSYSYALDNDRDFELTTGYPNARAVAVARGLETFHPDSLRGVLQLTESESLMLTEKHNQWVDLVAICRERLAAAGPDWMKSVEKALADADHAKDPWERRCYIMKARRNKQMLLWCQLFAAPWSKERHAYYSANSRRLIRELLRIGSLLDKRSGHRGELKEMFDKEILPFAL